MDVQMHVVAILLFCFVLYYDVLGQSSESFSSSEGLLPCSYRGQIIFHGDQLIVDECTTCSCDNSTVKCDIKSCPPTFCEEPLTDPAECCDLCPYYVPVWRVTPNINRIIIEGNVSYVTVDLNLKINDKGQGVEGEGLWKVNMWGSANEDGSGNHVGYINNVLTGGQAATQLVRPPLFGGFEFTLPDIEVSLDGGGAFCADEIVYLCVEFGKGDEPDPVYPQLPFDVEGVESEEDASPNPQHLIGCERLPAEDWLRKCDDGDQDSGSGSEIWIPTLPLLYHEPAEHKHHALKSAISVLGCFVAVLLVTVIVILYVLVTVWRRESNGPRKNDQTTLEMKVQAD